MNHKVVEISEAVCHLNSPVLKGDLRWLAVLCLHFLCSNFYFYPLDMILIVSCRPQRLNSFVKPPQSPLFYCSLGRREQLMLPIYASF